MTPREVGTFEAKTHLSALLSQVEEGQSFYITRHGRRIAELRPAPVERKPRRAGFGKGLVKYMAPDFDDPLPEFEADYYGESTS